MAITYLNFYIRILPPCSATPGLGAKEPTVLRVQATASRRVGNPPDRQSECRRTQSDVMFARREPDITKRSEQNPSQPSVDLIRRPEERLTVLYPLEIAGGHSARVAQDVWNDD